MCFIKHLGTATVKCIFETRFPLVILKCILLKEKQFMIHDLNLPLTKVYKMDSTWMRSHTSCQFSKFKQKPEKQNEQERCVEATVRSK